LGTEGEGKVGQPVTEKRKIGSAYERDFKKEEK